jgi:hypothetical protein
MQQILNNIKELFNHDLYMKKKLKHAHHFQNNTTTTQFSRTKLVISLI